MRMSWDLGGALEGLAGKLREMDGDVVGALKECVNAGIAMSYTRYKEGLRRHEDTGAALDSIEFQEAKVDGNLIYGDVGSSIEKNEAGFIHARYQEYGAFVRNGDYVTFVADPWKRPADDEVRAKYKAVCRKIIKGRLGT